MDVPYRDAKRHDWSTLSEDLTAHIMAFWSESRTVPALVCKKWQHAAERLTFADLTVKSTDLASFAEYYGGDANAHRRAALRSLRFVIILPPHSDQPWKKCSRNERAAEERRNNLAFTQTFKELFTILGPWEDSAIGIALFAEQLHSASHTTGPRSELKLISPIELPMVNCIKEFEMNHSRARAVQPASMALLAWRMPHLEKLKLGFCDIYELYNSVGRRKHRSDFAMELHRLFGLHSLKELELVMPSGPPFDQMLEAPSILLPDSPADALSQNLHILSQRLDLSILCITDNAVVSSDLFWPSDASRPSPHWLHLTNVRVDLGLTAPDGGWYFVRDHNFPLDDDADPEDEICVDDETEAVFHEMEPSPAPAWEKEESLAREKKSSDDALGALADTESEPPRYIQWDRAFRVWPSDKLEALLIAMARAVDRMPAVKTLLVEAKVYDFGKRGLGHKFRVDYSAPGQRSYWHDPDGDVTKPRLWLVVPRGWRMSVELEKLWRVKLGPDGVVNYYEW